MDSSDMKNGTRSNLFRKERSQDQIQCEEGPGVVAYLLTLGSFLLVAASLPFALFFVVKVVQVMLASIYCLSIYIFRSMKKLLFFN